MSDNYEYIELDTDKLQTEIDRLKNVKKNLDEIFEKVEKDTTNLKDIWESKTSDTVQEAFNDYYKNVEKTKNNIASDIAFLESAVKAAQIKEEERQNKVIDENIALGA